LDIKFLDDLEDKVQTLITTLENVRKENDRLKQDLKDTNSKITVMESDNNQLKKELDALKTNTNDHQNKLDTVTKRIQSILARLESVN
jgi:FtsZ-binding cell division protein ZapB